MLIINLVIVTGGFIMVTFLNVMDRNYAFAVVWAIISHANVALSTRAICSTSKEKE